MRSKYILIPFFLLILFSVSAQNAKVVGYIPSYKFNYNNSLSYCKLTHLNICFANPDADGNLIIDDFSAIVSKAKKTNPNIIISISVGGGWLSESVKKNWSELIDIPEKRPPFIAKIVAFVKQHNLDGIDVDLEWEAVTSGYSAFVTALGDSVHAAGKQITAALPGTYRYGEVTRDVINTLDFINVMAYDETGPWSPNKPGQHSSYDFAVRSVNFWKSQGVSAEKLILGVPFYGYNFNNSSNVFAFSFADMVAKNTTYADLDNVEKAYYNGRPTIADKVEFASKNCAGIMIWELAQDRFDSYSLLTTIHNKYTELGITTTALCGNVTATETTRTPDIRIFPNPASSVVYIEGANALTNKVEVFDIYGEKVKVLQQRRNDTMQIDVSGFKSGIYFIRITSNQSTTTAKIIVQASF